MESEEWKNGPRCLFRLTFLLLSILSIRNISLRLEYKMLLGSQEKVKPFGKVQEIWGEALVGDTKILVGI